MGKKLFWAALVAMICIQPALADDAVVQDDQFNPAITILGPEDYKNPLGGTFRSWRLRSWINRQTRTVENQLYVEFGYFGDWRFYQEATTDTAQVLEVVPIDRQVKDCSGICSFSEIVGVTLPTELLRARAESGLQVKIFAKSGDSQIIAVSPEQISAQLAALDPLVQSPAAAATTPESKAKLGVYFAALNPQQLSALHIASDHGMMVLKVAENSAAARAGIVRADVILSFNGKAVSTTSDLTAATGALVAGAKATVHLWRGGSEMDLQVQF